ncbi:MAG: AtpZ/AtpI family protein [Abditibacteriota bacterium]|nr:AtpZ/AtpI family protein [Abditibacteriota bacterium]
MEDKDQPLSPQDTELFIAGIQIAVCFLLCAGAGYFLDMRYHTGSRYTCWGVALGLVSGLGNFVRALIGALRDKR